MHTRVRTRSCWSTDATAPDADSCFCHLAADGPDCASGRDQRLTDAAQQSRETVRYTSKTPSVFGRAARFTARRGWSASCRVLREERRNSGTWVIEREGVRPATENSAPIWPAGLQPRPPPVITSSDQGWQARGPRQAWLGDDYFLRFLKPMQASLHRCAELDACTLRSPSERAIHPRLWHPSSLPACAD
jgi:hypothetical protein